MRIDEVNEEMSKSSINRMAVFNKYKTPKTKQDVINMLSDTSNCDYPVFRDALSDPVRTIAVGKIMHTFQVIIEVIDISIFFIGIFDCVEKTWALYSDKANENEPLVVLPLVLKSTDSPL